MNINVDISKKTFRYKNRSSFELYDIKTIFKANRLNVIVGPSGSGKTSLVNIICGLEKLEDGDILYDDINIKNMTNQEIFSSIVYIPIDNNNLNSLTVKDNLSISCNDDSSINLILKELKIDDLINTQVFKLSKGEQQRVAVARGILSNKEVLLIDEPTANLDTRTSELIFSVLQKASMNKNIIVITHDVSLAEKHADYILEIADGTTTNEKTFERENNKFKLTKNTIPSISRITFKLLLSSFFKKKISFIISLLLVSCSLMLLFSIYSLRTADENKSFDSTIKGLPYSIYDVSFKEQLTSETPKNFMDRYGAFRKMSIGPMENGKTFETVFSNNEIATLIGKNIDDYSISIVNTQNTWYYPIIVNQKTLDIEQEITNQILKKGDILPWRINLNIYENIQFVIVDIFEIGEKFDESESVFPSVISEKVQIDLITNYGIRDRNFGSFFASIADEYNRYSEQYGFEERCPKLYGDAFMNKAGNISEIFHDIDNVPNDGGFFLVGRMPENENEIVVNNYWLYRRLSENAQEDSRFDALLAPGFKVDFDGFFPQLTGAKTLKIVGYYGEYVKDQPIEWEPFQKKIIVFDGLYDSLYKAITEDKYSNIEYLDTFFIFKEALVKNAESIKNGDIVIAGFDKRTYDNEFNNLIIKSDFLRIISLVVLAILILQVAIILMNFIKRTATELSILYMNGYQRYKIAIMTTALLFLAYTGALLIAISFSSILFEAQVAISAPKYHEFIVFDNILAYLLIIGIFFAFIVSSSWPALMLTKKRTLAVIKRG